MTTWNLADLFAAVATAIPDRMAVTSPSSDRTYGELNDNATALAHHLATRGIDHGDRVAILSWNRVEWLEAMIGCFRAGAVPVNINYRYVDEEVRYLLDDSDSKAVICEAEFAPLLRRIRASLPALGECVVIGENTDCDNGSEQSWPAALASGRAAIGPLPELSGDDNYMLYTGGTTGMPKGVLWRQEDIFLAAMTSLVEPDDPTEVVSALVPERAPWLVTSPLMHGNGQWNSLRPLLAGNGVSLWTGHRFDPVGVIQQASNDGAQLVVLIGDGMARPFADTLRHMMSNGTAPDLSKLLAIASGGAILSPVVKTELAELLPHTLVVDGFGASESGGNGQLVGTDADGAPRFQMKPNTTVLGDDNRPLAPGTGQVGRLASTGRIPLGYHNDPVKTAATFPTIDGVRWAVPGDAARLEADGTITVFGRGSNCINTGGEKVFPEEVESKLKTHPEVADAFVVGQPDERFGQQVAAVVSRRPGSQASLDDLRTHLRHHLAGYKLPKSVVFVDAMSYTGPGKPDYKWARAQFDQPKDTDT